MGPYRFVEYGARRLTATIADSKGKRSRCSVSNLIPLRPEPKPAWVVQISETPRIPGEDLAPGEVEVDEDDDDLATGDLEDDEDVEGVPVRKKPREDWDKDFWPSGSDTRGEQ